MNEALRIMLERYTISSLQEYDQALREILQEIALVGLWRGKFFEHAAFYGGTALRIFYHLDRFSEDLDFTIIDPNHLFSWGPYASHIEKELASFGFEAHFLEKEKVKVSAIQSAFLKTKTIQESLQISFHSSFFQKVHRDSLIQIKIEIDTNPSILFPTEQKFLLHPIPISVRCVSQEALFAAKVCAAFYRSWKKRVKGRDWYDLCWFVRRDIPLNLSLFSKLRACLEIPTPHSEPCFY